MTVPHGRNTKVYAAGYDLSGYFRGARPSAERDTPETTTYGNSARTYIPGLLDATLTLEGFWDSTELVGSDVRLAAMLGLDASLWCVLPPGDALGNRGYGFQAVQSKYEPDSPFDGAVSLTAEAQSQVGFEPLISLHAKGQETEDGEGTAVNNGASSANGAVGYLHVFAAASGQDITVVISDSPDGITYSPLITFTATDAIGAERIEVAGTVEQYVRAEWDFTQDDANDDTTFFVGFCRK